MKALALLLCLALPAYAGTPTPADAPVRVKAGSVVPFDGVLESEAGFVEAERSAESDRAARKVLEQRPPVAIVVVAIVGAAVAGAAAAVGVTCAVTKGCGPK